MSQGTMAFLVNISFSFTAKVQAGSKLFFCAHKCTQPLSQTCMLMCSNSSWSFLKDQQNCLKPIFMA